jgi:hypothetical protein
MPLLESPREGASGEHHSKSGKRQKKARGNPALKASTTLNLQRQRRLKKNPQAQKTKAMGVPSSPASNAIIYLTYGAFLCVEILLCHSATLTTTQSGWLLHRMAAAASIKVRMALKQQDTKGLEIHLIHQ